MQFHIGYGWLPNLSPERMENRLWEQALFQGGKMEEEWAWLARGRLEQRHIEFTSGVAHRFRGMLRVSRLLSGMRWGAALWDEVFWNLNSLTKGPAAGFDQNRFFVGPLVQVMPGCRLELGYLSNFVGKGATTPSTLTHIFFTAVNLDF